MIQVLPLAARLEIALKKVIPSAHSVRIGKKNDRSTWKAQGVPPESQATVDALIASFDDSEEAAKADTLEYHLDQPSMLTAYLEALCAELSPNRPWESVKQAMKVRLRRR